MKAPSQLLFGILLGLIIAGTVAFWARAPQAAQASSDFVEAKSVASSGCPKSLRPEAVGGPACKACEQKGPPCPACQIPAIVADARDLTQNVAVLIATAPRKDNVMYVGATLRRLQEAGLPAEAVMVLQAGPPGSHTRLDALRNTPGSWLHEYPVRIIEREGPFVPFDEWAAEPDALAQHKLMTGGEYRATTWMHKDAASQRIASDPALTRYWRAKSLLDIALLLREGLWHFKAAKWFIFLEDDMAYNVRQPILEHIKQYMKPELGSVLLRRGLGMAPLMTRTFTEAFMSFSQVNYDQMPQDWLWDRFLRDGQGLVRVPDKATFAHIGVQGSLEGNVRNLEIPRAEFDRLMRYNDPSPGS